MRSSRTNSGWDDSTDEETAVLDAEPRDGAAFSEHEIAAGARTQPSRPQLMTDSVPTQIMPAPPYNLAMTRWRRNDDTGETLGLPASHSTARPINSGYTSPIATNPKSVQRVPCHEVCYECAVPNSNDLQHRQFEPCTHQYCPNCGMSFAPREPAPSGPCWPVTSSHEDLAGQAQHMAERPQASVSSVTATPESNFRQAHEGSPYNMGAQYANFDHNPPTLTPSSGGRLMSSYSVSTPLPQQGLYCDTTEHPQPAARDAFAPTGAHLTVFAYGGQDDDQNLISQNDFLSLQNGISNDDLFFAHPDPKPTIKNAPTFTFDRNAMADFSFPSDSSIPFPQTPMGQNIYQNTLRLSVDEIGDSVTFPLAQSPLTASSLGPGQYYPQDTAAPITDLHTERSMIDEMP